MKDEEGTIKYCREMCNKLVEHDSGHKAAGHTLD